MKIYGQGACDGMYYYYREKIEKFSLDLKMESLLSSDIEEQEPLEFRVELPNLIIATNPLLQ